MQPQESRVVERKKKLRFYKKNPWVPFLIQYNRTNLENYHLSLFELICTKTVNLGGLRYVNLKEIAWLPLTYKNTNNNKFCSGYI